MIHVVTETTPGLEDPAKRRTGPSSRLLAELPALSAVWISGLLLLLPALRRGRMLGNYDWLRNNGLTSVPGSPPGNFFQTDVILQMIPWSNLAWIQVHHGHLPLWNPYNFLGSPLAFNWQSAAFSVPALLGYLTPLSMAFTTQVIAVILLAGTGAYVCARALGVSRLSSAWAGISFCLSGTMVHWLGWSAAAVLGLLGWVLASGVMVCRSSAGPSRWWTASLAVAVAASIYGGQLDVLGAEIVVIVGSLLLVQLASALRHGEWRAAVVPILRLAPGMILGVLLAAPLLLPGIQLARHSIRSSTTSSTFTLSPVSANQLLHQLLPGIVTPGGSIDLDSFGAVASVLAVVAVVACWRRRVVRVAACGVVLQILLSTATPIHDLAARVPLIENLRFPRSMLIMVFFLALLSAIGLDALRRGLPLARGSASVALAVAVGFGGLSIVLSDQPGASTSVIQLRGLWTSVTALILLLWLVLPRFARDSWRSAITMWAAPTLLVAEVAFLVASGSSWITSSPTGFPQTRATRTLQRVVGADPVGFGISSLQAELGIAANANAAYGVHEIAGYDPMVPTRLFQAWTGQTGRLGGARWASLFLPGIETLEQARSWGARWIIEPAGSIGPSGTRFAAQLGAQSLWRVPRAWQVSQAGLGTPVGDASEHGVTVHWASPSHGRAVLSSRTASVVRLRVLDVPGWSATIDGRATPLRPLSGAMLQLRAPPGRHLLEIEYLPSSFLVGLLVAALSLGAMTVWLLVDPVVRRRRARAPSTPIQAAG